MSDVSRCPAADQIAAFVAGRLGGNELRKVKEHFTFCDDCRRVLAEAARTDRENAKRERVSEPALPVRSKQGVRPWWLAIAAGALAGLAIWSWLSTRSKTPSPTKILIDAAPHDARYLEPRISGGFPWAPLIPARRSGTDVLDPQQMKTVDTADEVLVKTASDPSKEAQHATALAHLLAGRPSEAVTLLTKLTKSAPSARVWNDLAAAQYALAVQMDRPAQFAHALTAADAALRLDPNYAEALFNRALTIERLGLRNEAREAWRCYVNVDSSSAWATEARRHLQGIR
jgi:tetratricopeptide (TPR) repeat protein